MSYTQDLIELSKKLEKYRSLGCRVDVQLPQVVVIGGKGVGKSSLFERLIGAPIYSGSVATQCPLVVQLMKTEEPEWIEFHEPESEGPSQIIKMRDYDVIRKLLFLRNCENRNISDKEIILHFHSPDCPVNMTFVDLPGIGIVGGAQTHEDLMREVLSRKYIDRIDTIILTVNQENVGINKDSDFNGILLAMEVDKEGKRSINVLTKLDLMSMHDDKDLQDVIGVINHSPNDINEGATVQTQIVKEKNFLEGNYPNLASVNGVPHLQSRIHYFMAQSVIKRLPEIKVNLEALLELLEDSLPKVKTEEEKEAFVKLVVSRFEKFVRRDLEQESFVRRRKVFHKILAKDLDDAEKKSEESVTTEVVNTFLQGALDTSSTFNEFVELFMNNVVKNQLNNLNEPLMRYAQRIWDDVEGIASRVLQADLDLDYFPKLCEQILNGVVGKKMKMEELGITENTLFTYDEEMMTSLGNLRGQLETLLQLCSDDDSDNDNHSQSQGQGREESILLLMKQIVRIYFNNAKSNCLGVISKLIGEQLVGLFRKGEGAEEHEVEMRVQLFAKDHLAQLTAIVKPENTEPALEKISNLKEAISELNGILLEKVYGNDHDPDSDTDSQRTEPLAEEEVISLLSSNELSAEAGCES